jgi:hypothetical protein
MLTPTLFAALVQAAAAVVLGVTVAGAAPDEAAEAAQAGLRDTEAADVWDRWAAR